MKEITKPVLRYESVHELQDFLKDFSREYLDEGAEDLMEIYSKNYSNPLIEKIGITIVPDIRAEEGEGRISLSTDFYLNVDAKRFLEETNIEDSLYGMVIFPDEDMDQFSVYTELCDNVFDRKQFKEGELKLENRVLDCMVDTNKVIGTLFDYVACEKIKEEYVTLDFGKLNLEEKAGSY